MDTALPQKFSFILDRNLAKANCTGNRVCTSCDIVVLGYNIFLHLYTSNSLDSYKHFAWLQFTWFTSYHNVLFWIFQNLFIRFFAQIVSCILQFVSCILQFVYCILQFVSCILQFVSCILQFVSCILQFVSCIATTSINVFKKFTCLYNY